MSKILLWTENKWKWWQYNAFQFLERSPITVLRLGRVRIFTAELCPACPNCSVVKRSVAGGGNAGSIPALVFSFCFFYFSKYYLFYSFSIYFLLFFHSFGFNNQVASYYKDIFRFRFLEMMILLPKILKKKRIHHFTKFTNA